MDPSARTTRLKAVAEQFQHLQGRIYIAMEDVKAAQRALHECAVGVVRLYMVMADELRMQEEEDADLSRKEEAVAAERDERLQARREMVALHRRIAELRHCT